MKDAYEKGSDRNILRQMERERAENELRGAVERIIDEAAKQGFFDNLPGKGKPLQLGKNRQAGENALAYDLLQNNNYTLPWIAARQGMLDKIAAFREALEDRWALFQWRQQKARDLEEREAARAGWEEEKARLAEQLRELNQAVAELNLTIPVEQLELLKLQWERELQQAGAAP